MFSCGEIIVLKIVDHDIAKPEEKIEKTIENIDKNIELPIHHLL